MIWSEATEQRVREAARSWDEQSTPAEVKFCKKCVVSNQRPRIVFDDEGVCSACRFAERKREVYWHARENQLQMLMDKHRSASGYDVVVPCSGGKDSSYIAHALKHDYGMTPLCTKWAPFMYTDIGWKNFQAFVHSGFDVMTFFPNGLMHRKLSRLAFEFLGDPFQPFVYGQLSYPMKIADKFGIGLVMYGENGEAEYGGDPSANDKPCWDNADWARVYAKGSSVNRLIGIGLELGCFDHYEASALSEFYDLPERTEAEFHWLSYYKFWHPQANFYYAQGNTGFETNPERSEGTYSKYASIDDKMDGLHYYMAYIKFGIGRCTSDAAHEIRDEDITREEAVALVSKFDGEFPERHLDECLDYLGMDREQLDRVIERFRNPVVWNGSNLKERAA